jgi:aspartyl protease family protein
MGTFNVNIEIGDPEGRRFEQVEALVDTGATLTSVPASLLRSLGVIPVRRGTFELADGRQVQMDIGETRVKVEGVQTTTSVLFGEEGAAPLLGAMTLEGLLLGVDPFNRRLVPVVGKLKLKNYLS